MKIGFENSFTKNKRASFNFIFAINLVWWFYNGRVNHLSRTIKMYLD